jgi:hypothetical protein
MGTSDGLSKMPYIRESRRVKAVKTILQQHLVGNPDNRARLFHDSVGIGHYAMDLHPCDMGQEKQVSVKFKPNESKAALFQVPWSAMVPVKTDGLIPACKNIGTTHITNGAYRIHPVEFEIGQAAGACAVLCVADKCRPRDMVAEMPSLVPSENEKRLRQLQHELLRSGVPIYWSLDCGWDNPSFEASQFSMTLEIIEPNGLKFHPDMPLTRAQAAIAAARLFGGLSKKDAYSGRFTDVCEPALNSELSRALTFLDDKKALPWLSRNFEADKPVTKAEFEAMLSKLSGGNMEIASGTSGDFLSRGQAAKKIFMILSQRYGLKSN